MFICLGIQALCERDSVKVTTTAHLTRSVPNMIAVFQAVELPDDRVWNDNNQLRERNLFANEKTSRRFGTNIETTLVIAVAVHQSIDEIQIVDEHIGVELIRYQNDGYFTHNFPVQTTINSVGYCCATGMPSISSTPFCEQIIEEYSHWDGAQHKPEQ